MGRVYEVAAADTSFTPDGKVFYGTGQRFTSDEPLAHEQALLETGTLSLVASGKVACPACAETLKRPPKFASHEELEQHYAIKHAGLVPPTEEEV